MPNGSNASASRSSGKSGGRFPTKILPLLLRTHINSPFAAKPLPDSRPSSAAQGATQEPPRQRRPVPARRNAALQLGRPGARRNATHCATARREGSIVEKNRREQRSSLRQISAEALCPQQNPSPTATAP